MTPSEKHAATEGWMRVLGIDPAAAGPTGYGIIESDGRCCRTLHYGALRQAGKRRMGETGGALRDVHELICKLIQDFSPDVLAVESIFSALNVRTALRLAEVRGVVLLAAAQYDLEVHSYAPREVKATITGHGHADKRQVQTMVRTLLSMNVTPEPSDAADALAVALCHLQSERMRLRLGLEHPNNVAPKHQLSRKAAAPVSCTPVTPVGSATRARFPRILLTR
jgi:crossover junction endodeoxyribonuclease RuvC